MKHFEATWSCSSTFLIPDDVYEYLHEKPYGKINTPGRWYIRYNTLYYLDKELDEQTIEGTEPDSDYKLPMYIENDEGEIVYEERNR